MSTILPINISDLLYNRGIESSRVEFKASWDESTTAYQVLKTICAYANDLHNLNGGYIVIGIEDNNGTAVLPPKGLRDEDIERIQNWIRGNCNRIDPEYQPIISPEVVDGKRVLVIWVPGSDIRPHRAPDGPKNEKKYWVRLGSSTVDAERSGVLQQLLELNARVPFDARRALTARIEDLRESKVREFLNDIRSGLLEEISASEIYRKMRISIPVNNHEVPKNVALMFFTDDPENWFPGARIEVVHFADNTRGNIQEEKVFRGPLHEQIRDCINYLETMSTKHIEKQHSDILVRGWVSFPLPALRESIVNAVYHRGYDNIREPIKVYLFTDRIEIISYPGPVAGIKMEHLKSDSSVPPVPARNRVIGEFLKELRLAEGRGTGLPKIFSAMMQNGSPVPIFEFDEDRTYFRVILSAHPEYVAISAIRNAAHFKAIGEHRIAINSLEEAWNSNPNSVALTGTLIDYYGNEHQINRINDVYKRFLEIADEQYHPYILNKVIDIFIREEQKKEALELLDKMPALVSTTDATDSAILAKRMMRFETAHRYFERSGDTILHDVRALHEFAQTKIWLARNNTKISTIRRKLYEDALKLLERVIQMEAPITRHAYAWRDKARALNGLNMPVHDVENAYRRAIALLPSERKFKDELNNYLRNKKI